MKLWSIRNLSEIEQLQNQGFFITAPTRISPDFVTAYRWISLQLAQKVPKPRAACQYPLWAWQCWDSERSCRPDLRVRWGKRGETLALMTCEIPDNLLLLSDYQLWHFVLNHDFLANNQTEENHFNALSRQNDAISQKTCEQLITDSWQRIFDWHSIDSDYFGQGLGTSIQAVCWEIRQEWITSVQYFRAK